MPGQPSRPSFRPQSQHSGPTRPIRRYDGPIFLHPQFYKLLSQDAMKALKAYNTEAITRFHQRKVHNTEIVETPQVLRSKLSRTDRRTFRPRFRWEMLIHIWISPKHWKDASGEKRSLESDNLYVFLCLEIQVYKYIYVIVDHWFFWVTG